MYGSKYVLLLLVNTIDKKCYHHHHCRNPKSSVLFANKDYSRSNTITNGKVPYPISVVIPAYNEADRIPKTLMNYLPYMKDRYENFEIVVVDDGSQDDTASAVSEVAMKLSIPFEQFSESINYDRSFSPKSESCAVKCLTLRENVGKGKALAAGIQFAKETSQFVLTTDADGSADISCLDRMIIKSLSCSRPNIVVGKRFQQNISMKRLVLRLGFKLTVQTLCFPLRLSDDTQCGFKLFPRKYAITLYNQLHLDRWSHDVEVLYLASLSDLVILEDDVPWTDIPGSKLVENSVGNIIKVSIQMLLEVLYMRIMYMFGIWKPDLNFVESTSITSS